ncbi:hypothetical protein U1Q18_020398 [Sarracenia purpurea var. burkii]
MAPNPRVAKAFRAMRVLGITEEKVKPVLKNLLKLYDKNWELIEEENYRALADAIFDQEEAQVTVPKKKRGNNQEDMDEEAQVHEEPERPLKRLRLRYQEGQVTPSPGNSSPSVGATSLRQPKREEAELPETRQLPQGTIELPHPTNERIGAGSHPLSSQPSVRNNGKQVILPKSSSGQERFGPSQPGATDRTQAVVTNRIESGSVSHPICLREKGKEPLSPQIVSRDKKAISGSSHNALRLKEPMVEHGVVLLSKQVNNSQALIKPKDEPFTEDMPHFEVPIAVIHPEPLNKDNSSGGKGFTRESDGPEPPVSQLECGEDRNDGLLVSSKERRTNYELANIVEESSSHLEIASSPSREVTISLTCNSALGRPDFHMPSIDAVVKKVEDKCLRSYKVLDPSFSVMKLMKDMCDCFLELATDSTNGSQETIDVLPAVDLLRQSDALDPSVSRGKRPNASVATDCAAEAACSQIPRLPPSSNGMVECARTNMITENSCEIDEEDEQNGTEHANSQSLVVVQQCQPTLNLRSLHDVNDIAKGEEKVVIPWVFMTHDDKGWGLRTLEDLPKGAFVCEYAGEVLTNAELYERISQSSNGGGHAYPVLLDADWGSEGALMDEKSLCLDATYFGNIARFINHR